MKPRFGGVSQCIAGAAMLAVAWVPLAPLYAAPASFATCNAATRVNLVSGYASSDVASSQAATSPRNQGDVQAAYKAAQAKLKGKIDASWLDVSARQKKIGSDPQAIWQFVQQQIGYEAYAGALRGARGTLLARAGNSVDRALLEAALLQAAGRTVRFATGALSAGQAEALVRSEFARAAPANPASAVSDTTDRALGHFVLIGNALDDAGFKAPVGDVGGWARSIREAQAHVWVQWENTGQWMDADSSPGVAYGHLLVAPARVDPAPDAAAFETVEFSVEIERAVDGKLTTQRVLDHQARAADLAGTPIGFYHQRTAKSATPALLIGDQAVTGTPLETGGADVGAGIARGLGAGLASVFGAPDTPARSTAVITAEWLDIHTTGPAGQQNARYTLVDTTGAEARRAGSPPADLDKAQPRVLAALDAVLGMVVVTGRIPASLPFQFLADTGEPPTPQPLIHILAAQDATYAAIRGAIPSSFFNTAPISYVDAPSVIVSRVQPVDDASDGGAGASSGMDLTLRAWRSLRMPEDPLRATSAPFYDNIAGGVLDHMVERWIFGPDARTGNVGAFFERAVDLDVSLRAIRAASDPSPDFLSPGARLRLSAATSRGEISIIPQSRPQGWTGEIGWWNVDPSTGWTEDTTEDGGHQMAERAVEDRASLRAYQQFCRIGGRVVTAATLLFALYQSGDLGSLDDPVDAADIIDFICRIADPDPEHNGPPRHNPTVPPPKPSPGGFPPTGSKFPKVPRAPKAPDVPSWWSQGGTWRKWR